MNTPKFTLTGKVNYFQKHEDGTYFMLLVHRTTSDEFFSYPIRYKGILPEILEQEFQDKPVIHAEGKLISCDENGKIGVRLYLTSFHILKAVV